MKKIIKRFNPENPPQRPKQIVIASNIKRPSNVVPTSILISRVLKNQKKGLKRVSFLEDLNVKG
jgi:hypothetical protein